MASARPGDKIAAPCVLDAVSLIHVVVQRLLGCARSCHIDEGLEDITVRPYPEQELAGSSSACRLQANLPEHVLAAPTRLDRAEAPPRPRTHVGQAGTGSNRAVSVSISALPSDAAASGARVVVARGSREHGA